MGMGMNQRFQQIANVLSGDHVFHFRSSAMNITPPLRK